MKRIAKESVYVWIIDALRKAVLPIGALTVMYKLGERFVKENLDAVLFCYWPLVAVIAYFFVKSVIQSFLKYQNTRYESNEEMIFQKRGGFTVLETSVPVRRIQHISIGQTFISRFFNLHYVTVYTAGNNLVIGFLKEDEAISLKEEIIDRLKKGAGEPDEQTA